MAPRILIPTLLSIPICAQALTIPNTHPVRIIIRAEKPRLNAPALDTAVIAKRLEAFAKDEDIAAPSPDSDGWVLGISLTTQPGAGGLLVGGSVVRLSPFHGEKLVSEGVKETARWVFTRKSNQLSDAIGSELVWQCRELLVEAKVIPKKSKQESKAATDDTRIPPMLPDEPKSFQFSQLRIRKQPLQPPYPIFAKMNGIQGTVVAEITIDPDGIPISATSIQGPDALIPYACIWALEWRFYPLTVNGHPDYGRFRLNMNFRLD